MTWRHIRHAGYFGPCRSENWKLSIQVVDWVVPYDTYLVPGNSLQYEVTLRSYVDSETNRWTWYPPPVFALSQKFVRYSQFLFLPVWYGIPGTYLELWVRTTLVTNQLILAQIVGRFLEVPTIRLSGFHTINSIKDCWMRDTRTLFLSWASPTRPGKKADLARFARLTWVGVVWPSAVFVSRLAY